MLSKTDWRDQRRKESCGGFVSLRILWRLARRDQDLYGSYFIQKHGWSINRLVPPCKVMKGAERC